MIEPDADAVPKPTLERISSLDPGSLLNLEWQQEICDDISSFGREKYVRFMEVVAKDHSLFGRVISYLEQRPIRLWICNLSALLGVLSTALYIRSTYVKFGEDWPAQATLECIIGVIYVAFFVIRVMLDGLNYIWSMEGILDLVTNWPSIAAIVSISPIAHNQWSSTGRLFRLLRMRYVVVVADKVSMAVTRQILVILATILSLAIVTAGMFQYVEFYNNGRYTTFYDDVYLTIMNITTVGPGDIRFVHIVSRFMVLATVAISFGVLPLQLTYLIRVWPPHSNRASSWRLSGHHVVVILPPEITADEIDDFLGELFHSNHGGTVFPVALLTSGQTSTTLMQALKCRTYYRYLTFLTGSPYEDRDLQRTNLSSARAAFILSRRSCESLEHENYEDMHTLMAAASVKNYCPAIPTIVQINNPQNGASVLWQNLSAFPNTQLLCVKRAKMSLLAGSCVCPGLHVLVGNMLQSFAASVDAIDSWHKEYIWGATNALFPTVFGAYFQGKRFLDAAVELYTAIDVMPIAVFKRSSDTRQVEILLCPTDYIIHDGDLVYVLCRDLERASFVPRYPDHHRRGSIASKLMKCPDLAASFQMTRQDSAVALKSSPEASSTITFASSVSYQGHIVICGYIDGSVIDLIGTLRKQILSKNIPVVIVCDTAPSSDLQTSLSGFNDISLIIGSLQDRKTLAAANLTAASHILLLANPFAKAQSDVHDQVVKVDFDSIVSLLELENYLHSETHRPDTNMMVEILFISNLRFIRPNFTYTPTALNELNNSFDSLRLPQLAAADGKIHASGMLQSIAAFAFYSPHILTIIDTLIYGSSDKDHRRIVMVEIPTRMVGIRYTDLVQRLASEYGVLAIALFRGRSVNRSPVPYVFTKPPPETVVSGDDRVYVLGPVITNLQRSFVRKTNRMPSLNRIEDLEQCLPIVTSTYCQRQENLESAIHMFQQALRSPTMRKSQLFEPDSPAWLMRIRSWWRSATRGMDFTWKAERAHEPHDYREFMKERNQRLGLATQTSRDGHEPRRSWEPFDYDDVHHVELSGLNSTQMLSESVA